MLDSITEYAELVCQQLRWKRARPLVEREIRAHLCDQRDTLIKNGMEEAEATREALRRMGDAVEIGTALDRVHRPKPAWELFVLTALLTLLGIFVRVFIRADGGTVTAVLIGFCCMMGVYFLDFTLIGKYPLSVYFGVLLSTLGLYLLLRTLFVNGSVYGKNVLMEYAVMLFPLAYASLLYRLRGKKYPGLLLALAGILPLSFCCFLIPSVFGLSVTLISALVLLSVAAHGDWFSIGRPRSMLFIGAAAITNTILLLLAVTVKSAISARVKAVFDPWGDPNGWGREGVIIREMISGARFLGRGRTGAYSADGLFCFDRATEFLLTWLIHQVGWIAFIAVAVPLAAFLFCGFRRCLKQRSMLGKLVSGSVMLTLSLQVMFYIATNLGFDLIRSISLPIISYGKTATVMNLALIGVMLSAFRSVSLIKDRLADIS